ncbi:hypothetical protein G7054_g6221 [Neopestalotiopsis clavispora]|nr:hypothetical protein G7054_g6221 [Neopestalotiopsis clavispora]
MRTTSTIVSLLPLLQASLSSPSFTLFSKLHSLLLPASIVNAFKMPKDKTTSKKTSKTSKSVGGSTTPIPASGRSARRASGRRPSTLATPYVSDLSIGTPQPGFAGPQHPFPGGPY